MKRTKKVIALGFVLALLAVPVAVFGDASVEVTPGGYFTTPDEVDCGVSVFSFQNGVRPCTSAVWQIEDSTLDDLGWHLNVTVSDFTSGVPADDFGANLLFAQMADADITAVFGTKVGVFAQIAASTPSSNLGISYINAIPDADGSSGIWDLDIAFVLNLPDAQPAGIYVATMTEALLAGP